MVETAARVARLIHPIRRPGVPGVDKSAWSSRANGAGGVGWYRFTVPALRPVQPGFAYASPWPGPVSVLAATGKRPACALAGLGGTALPPGPASPEGHAPAPSAPRRRLSESPPVSRLSVSPAVLSLSLGAFAIGTAEFVAMGLLPWSSADLGLDAEAASHVVSAYAIGVVIGAPLTTLLGARLPRRRYLAALIGFYGLANLLSALLPGYPALVATRFLAGLPHGGFLGVASLFAASALPYEQRARGAVQVMMGLTVANIVGVPLAGGLGKELGWRIGFALPGVLALVSAVLVLRLAPRAGADRAARPFAELKALADSAVLLTLAVGAIGFGGMFAVYSFLTEALLRTTDAPGWVVPAMLALFGVGATLATLRVGAMTVRHGVFKAAAAVLATMAGVLAFSILAIGNWPLMLATAFLLGFGGGLGIPLQVRLMDVAGEAQSMAAAMNHAAFNAANALGPFLAGIAINRGLGYRAPGWIGLGLTAGGALMLALAWAQARRRAR